MSETMPVAERFVSINGEGLHAGKMSAFIRFAGCDLSCSYCDTSWARSPGAATETLTVDDLVIWAFSQATACITLTGGEPLEQPLLLELLRGLLEHDSARPRVIEVETNGAHDLSDLTTLREELCGSDGSWNRLSITMDYKLPSSGMIGAMDPARLGSLGADDAVKFVCEDENDLLVAKDIIDGNGLTLRTNVLLSPVFGKIDPAAIVDFMKSNSMADVRLQLQLHKIIWPNSERGV